MADEWELFGGPERAKRDVEVERAEQRLEFTTEDDDALTPSDWIARIAKHTGRAVAFDPEVFRHEMVVIGALACAAIESFDRKFG
jgi:hypothetical protein